MSMDIVILGLTLSSSWGNGHATTFRSLLRGLNADGHRVLFLERDAPWYAPHRDLPDPDFCELRLYDDIPAMLENYRDRLLSADAVIVGSYVPEGPRLIDALHEMRPNLLCFYDIDTPVTMDKLDAGDEEYLSPRQIPLFDIYFSFSGGEVLDHLEGERGAQRAEALYCSVDPDRYASRPDAPKKWDLGYLGTYSPDRQPPLEQLLIEPARRLPEMRFIVAGPGYPDDIDWPDNVERIDHLPPAEHEDFYNAQRFTLNVTRAAMRRMGWSPSVRLFEAAACGTPIVSDAWRGLSELLPDGEAAIIAETTEDVVRALTDLNDAERRKIGKGGMDRVLSAHTGRARARDLVRALSSARADAPQAVGM